MVDRESVKLEPSENMTFYSTCKKIALTHFLFVFSMDSQSSGHEADRSFDAEFTEQKDRLMRKAKSVRFDDILDDSAPGRMGSLRRKLKTEDTKNKVKKEVSECERNSLTILLKVIFHNEIESVTVCIK
jgi:hypothetical protein